MTVRPPFRQSVSSPIADLGERMQIRYEILSFVQMLLRPEMARLIKLTDVLAKFAERLVASQPCLLFCAGGTPVLLSCPLNDVILAKLARGWFVEPKAHAYLELCVTEFISKSYIILVILCCATKVGHCLFT